MMKKQLLTSAMAVAMLAPTAAAFAADTTVTGTANTQYDSELIINGEIYADDNTAPVGQINITLPTAAAFAVDAQSTVIGASGMKIKNDVTSTGVKVSIASFSDSTPTSGIILKSTSELTTSNQNTMDRSNVNLKLSANGQEGIDLLNTTVNQKLVALEAGDTATLALTGVAGTKPAETESTLAETGISEDFTLTFKIAKK